MEPVPWQFSWTNASVLCNDCKFRYSENSSTFYEQSARTGMTGFDIDTAAKDAAVSAVRCRFEARGEALNLATSVPHTAGFTRDQQMVQNTIQKEALENETQVTISTSGVTHITIGDYTILCPILNVMHELVDPSSPIPRRIP